MKKLEFKIYKHEFGQNLVMSLLGLGKDGFDHIVWDGINSKTDEEWTLLSKGENELTFEDVDKMLEGVNRNGETWEIPIPGNRTAIIIGPNVEFSLEEEAE